MNNRIVNRDVNLMSISGRIKIGQKNEHKGYPESLDYFVATGKFAENFKIQYGEKPNKILIFFPNNDSLIQQYVLYVDGKRYGVSDGQTVEVVENKEFKKHIFDTHDEAIVFMQKYAESLDKKQKSKAEWKLTLSMKFVIAELRNIMGLWQFETSGKASMVNQIANSHDNTRDWFGSVVGVPFWLTVEKVKHLSAKDNSAKIFPVVSLTAAIGYKQLIELKTGAKNMLELIDNTVNMIMPKQAKEIPQNTVKEIASVPTQKILTAEEAHKVHEKIESGTGNVNTAIDYYKSKNYAFYEAIFTEPRTSYLESIVNSINTEEELTTAITNLEQKGYIISEKIISIIQNLLDKK